MTIKALNWKTARRTLSLEQPLVMGILNVTPDSFSDGGRFASVDAALRQAEQMIADGADIIDVGGESTRPGGVSVAASIEADRTLPVIAAITKRFDTPVSIDTTKWLVARAAIDHGGAEIINDISGLRWDARLADVAAGTNAGLVLMHSRGAFETMHSEPPAEDLIADLRASLLVSIETAKKWGVREDQIALDIGIGFGKTPEQNLELLANLGNIIKDLGPYPMLVGASRKSFLGKILDDVSTDRRLGASIAAAIAAVIAGASIVRVHDVRETVAALRTFGAITARKHGSET